MVDKPISSLAKHFSKVTDPRGPNIEHRCFDIIVIALLGTICGADGWVEIEQCGYQKLHWLSQYLWLGNGIPALDIFGRVFSQIDAEEFQASFTKWVQALHKIMQGQVSGSDGKQLGGSHDRSQGKRAIYLVSAWGEQNHFGLGQRQVAEKSNEITALPELLRRLEIKGGIVRVDAIGSQTKIARQITQAEGDYLLAVKHNQGKLYRDLEMLFSYDQQQGFPETPNAYAKEVQKGHGRSDVCACWTTSDPAYLASVGQAPKWTNLKSIVMLVRKRSIAGAETVQTPSKHVFTSRAWSPMPNETCRLLVLSTTTRNGLQWVLDIAFNEDRSRVRKEHAPANLTVLRPMAVNLLISSQCS